MFEVTFEVLGLNDFNDDGHDRRREALLCEPGTFLKLQSEPLDRLDGSSVSVWRMDGNQLGYVAAEHCGWLTARMATEECVAIFQSQDQLAIYIRVRLGGGAPKLLSTDDRLFLEQSTF